MPTPCESWPRRFASTRLVATRSASVSEEPPARAMARTAAVSGSARKVRVVSVMGQRYTASAPRAVRLEHQQRPEVVDVGVGRPGDDQVAEALEEGAGVVAVEEVLRLQSRRRGARQRVGRDD